MTAAKTNREAAHSYFYDDEPRAAKSLNVSICGNVFYSYATSIAARVAANDGGFVLLISADTMSPTTGRHISHLMYACPYPASRIIEIPLEWGDRMSESVRWIEWIIPERFRARLRRLAAGKLTRSAARVAFMRMYAHALRYSEQVYALPWVREEFECVYSDCFRREEALRQKRKARREREERERARMAALDAPALFKTLVSARGETHRAALARLRRIFPGASFVWRTPTGDFFTSQGVTVSKALGERALAAYRAGTLTNGELVDRYTVREQTAQHVQIGCHRIPVGNIAALSA